MTLRQRYNDALGKISVLEAEKAALDAALASARGTIAQRDATITDLRAQLTAKEATEADLRQQLAAVNAELAAVKQELADLKGQIDDEPFQAVPAGANLVSVLREAGPSASLQLPPALELSGTALVYPGQHLRGPVHITRAAGAGVDIGINCKSKDAQGAILENIEASGFGLRGLVPWGGVEVIDFYAHDCGEMGIGFDGDGADLPVCLLVRPRCERNGKDQFVGHGASGMKFFHAKRVRVVEPIVKDCTGNGVWFDAECGWGEVIGGEISGCLKKAVFFEKCGGNHGAGVRASSGQPYDGQLVVDGTYMHDNNPARSNGDGGVYCAASKNIVVRNLRSARNGYAVVVRNDPDRTLANPQQDHPGWEVSNVELEDSTNDYGGERVVIGTDVQGVRRT